MIAIVAERVSLRSIAAALIGWLTVYERGGLRWLLEGFGRV